jgi:hypothetical protein
VRAPLAARSNSLSQGRSRRRHGSSRASRVASKALTRKRHRSRINRNAAVVRRGHPQEKQRKRNRSARAMTLAGRWGQVRGRIIAGGIRLAMRRT